MMSSQLIIQVVDRITTPVWPTGEREAEPEYVHNT